MPGINCLIAYRFCSLSFLTLFMGGAIGSFGSHKKVQRFFRHFKGE